MSAYDREFAADAASLDAVMQQPLSDYLRERGRPRVADALERAEAAARPVTAAAPETPADRDAFRCPDCGSPQPSMHPAVSGGGEVTRICAHPFHGAAQAPPWGLS